MEVANVTYEESAERLRTLLKTGLLRHSDLVEKPERFFLAHKLLAEYSPQLGPGFWIRFTVHYNLCIGTILGLGNDDQIQEMEEMQELGHLGCFSLTERFAGVNSGFIVQTTADWDNDSKTFVINSPDFGSQKNWISQGLVADKSVVVADLRLDGKSFGPHAFVMDLRKNGALVDGVTLGDMGHKTVGNDLDNAWICFQNVRLPKQALLNRYADVEESVDGEVKYVQKIKGIPVFHMIGQRLFTGRVAVAQAALAFRREIYNSTKAYTDAKLCWSPDGNVSLTTIPQISSLYAEANDRASYIEKFVQACEDDLSECLRLNSVPSLALVEAIAVAKVKAVEESIDLTFRLKNEVGSYALMGTSGFGQTDFLQCCKFAEGDSRVLMQKMARDRMKIFTDAHDMAALKSPLPDWDEETRLCFELYQGMTNDLESQRALNKFGAWNLRWREVYGLAEAVMRRVITNYLKKRVV
ncbi:POX5 [Symbiodinium microadriaticum]|nr:POX5 [Symbiodinium microadriaticum]